MYNLYMGTHTQTHSLSLSLSLCTHTDNTHIISIYINYVNILCIEHIYTYIFGKKESILAYLESTCLCICSVHTLYNLNSDVFVWKIKSMFNMFRFRSYVHVYTTHTFHFTHVYMRLCVLSHI